MNNIASHIGLTLAVVVTGAGIQAQSVEYWGCS